MNHPIAQHWNEISLHPTPQWLHPESQDALRQFLRQDSGTYLLCGNGSKWWLGNPSDPVGHCIDLRGLNRVLEYSPGDLTVNVEAGISLFTLNSVLSEKNQTFPVDPPMAREATIGGIVAVGISGPLQQLYGSVRDKVLGMKVMHADGTITRAGGRVVKNVAGYDLCKLYTGSLGTLVAILEVILRVFPASQATRSVVIPTFSCEQAKAMFMEMRRMPLAPSGVVYWEIGNQSPCLLMRICGAPKLVDEQASRLASEFPSAGIQSADLIGSAFHSFYRNPCPIWLRIESLLSSMEEVVRRVCQELMVNSAMIDFSSGRCHFAVSSASAEDLGRIRGNLKELNAALIIEKAPLSLKQQVDVWGSTRSDLMLARKIKATLDPRRRFNPGIYVRDI
ncbi:MAG: FAD-binding protein [Acidobacteria bacterium]|nr:FAD-binding protein [Acidobacteriota bacterium]